ncbi:hypothetical protein F4778DRAFT_711743 [Xylariomycetidae sp. FL2044]|nr:hypothetical protein F4778DRAFT_711743 [Xylariomycetidae sp. FL2044]
MVRINIAIILTVAATALAAPRPMPQAGSGNGKQFITGPCQGPADCASNCCRPDTQTCAAVIVAYEAGAGCGNGGADDPRSTGANNGTGAGGNTQVNPQDNPDAAGPGKGNAKQFITGPCQGPADCASNCCRPDTQTCAAVIVAYEAGTDCGNGGADDPRA